MSRAGSVVVMVLESDQSLSAGDTLENEPVIATTRDLIRMDTTNYGRGKSNGEAEAAEYIADRLKALDLDVTMLESEPNRVSLVTRISGANQDKPALVVHGHTDVVPADPADWSVDPFSAEIRDGCIWGRGAVDMKDMDAMILTSLEDIIRSGRRPERDLIVAFFADEEDSGHLGSRYVVDNRPDLFEGATEAISEVGGYSVNIGDKRAYLLQTGEKALMWLTLRVKRPAGHGSRLVPAENNAISVLAGAIARLVEHEWPVRLNETTEQMVEALSQLLGMDGSDPHAVATKSGKAAGFLTASLRTTVNPTMLNAGYKHNVIPETASVALDVRPFPDEEDAVLAEIQRVVGDDIEIETNSRDVGTRAPVDSPLTQTATSILERHDPGAQVVPYFLSAGTDNKALSRLGINGYGFVPLKLPADMDFPAMFHGVDERVPLESLVFGKQVLTDFLLEY